MPNGIFGEALRAWRESRGLSQGQLAAALGKRQSTISGWERGRDPRSASLEALIEFYGAESASKLLAGPGER